MQHFLFFIFVLLLRRNVLHLRPAYTLVQRQQFSEINYISVLQFNGLYYLYLIICNNLNKSLPWFENTHLFCILNHYTDSCFCLGFFYNQNVVFTLIIYERFSIQSYFDLLLITNSNMDIVIKYEYINN